MRTKNFDKVAAALMGAFTGFCTMAILATVIAPFNPPIFPALPIVLLVALTVGLVTYHKV